MEQILYFLFWATLFYFMMRMGGCCGPTGHKHEQGEHEGHEHAKPAVKTGLGPFDPVCGMDVSDRTPLTTQFEGKTYYFCSTVCKNVFEKEPHKYMSGKDKEQTGGCC